MNPLRWKTFFKRLLMYVALIFGGILILGLISGISNKYKEVPDAIPELSLIGFGFALILACLHTALEYWYIPYRLKKLNKQFEELFDAELVTDRSGQFSLARL